MDVTGDGGGRVPEDLHHRQRHAVAEGGAGCGVPQGVQPGVGQTGSGGRDLEGTKGVARVARLAGLGRDDEAGLAPRGASVQPLSGWALATP